MTRVFLLAKLHFISGVQAFVMPHLVQAKRELPEDSLMRKQLELTQNRIENQHENLVEKLGR